MYRIHRYIEYIGLVFASLAHIDRPLYQPVTHTAKPVGSACSGEHHNATNVSRISATL